MRWEDLGARARGLATHLIPGPLLEELVLSPDLPALATRFNQLRIGDSPSGPDPASLELQARREAARRLKVLFRWLGSRAPVLAVILDDEDRRSIRAMLRGAIAGIPAASRLSGLIPTPSLPERALEELAARGKISEIVTLLTLWHHPFATALGGQTEAADLTRVELALLQAYAARASHAAPAGGSVVRDFVAETIDLLNAESALVLAAGGAEVRPEEAFVPGGRSLDRAAFLDAASRERAEAAARIAVALRGSGFGRAFRPGSAGPSEAELLGIRIRAWHRRARRSPLGPAPVLEYLLRLRAQVLDLRALIWSNALGMPPELRRGLLVAR
jgi:vacuolar-type H+-ATPase subunit C/Vma6